MVASCGETVRLVILMGFSGNLIFMSLFVIYYVAAAESMLRWGSHLHPEASAEAAARSFVSVRL